MTEQILRPQLPVDMPVVTTVIANHNYGQWVGEAMRSVDAQDYPNKQLVVIDDGSTDNSWNVIKLVASLNVPTGVDLVKKNTAYTGRVGSTPTVAYHFDQAGGPSRARNLGIKLAWPSTHIFAFLDADDIFLQGRLSKAVAKIMEDPAHIGGVYTDYETVSVDTGRIVREYKEPFSRDKLLRECMIHSACVVTKPALEKAGGYDEQLRVAEDYDLWLRITESFLILHIPESLMRVRVGSHNSTGQVKKEIWETCWKRVVEKTQARLNARK